MLQSSNIAKRYADVTETKAGGATYTPTELADFVAEKIIITANFNGLDSINVLDPAVGGGELLLSFLRKLDKKQIKKTIVYGFDTDRNAVIESRRRISTEYPSIKINIYNTSFLDFVVMSKNHAAKSSDFFEDSGAVRSFDFIIANPPYVRTQIMGADQAQELTAAFGLNGRVDLYHAFLMGIANVLRPHGMAGIIVSNRFMTTKGGSAVREALLAQFNLCHIWDLGDTKLFSEAVLPAVILAEGRNGDSPSEPKFSTIYETDESADVLAANPIEALSLNGTIELEDGRRFRVQHGTLDRAGKDAVWRIATDSGDAWLATVKAHSWGTFRDIGKIRVGVKTCADKIFIRSDWETMAEQPELLRSLTTHHVARRFRAAPPKKNRAIVYPHEVVKGQRRAIDLSPYPKTKAYLENHRPALESRTYVIEGGRHWYELWVPQDPAAWAAPKLVFRDISERPTFWLDLDGSVVNGDCYWITASCADQQGLLWLAAAVANSTFAEAFYDHRFNNKLYAGRRRFITQYVEQFPLPDPATSLAQEIIARAKAIYAVAGTAKADLMEKQLDQMIWEAFGLPLKKVVG